MKTVSPNPVRGSVFKWTHEERGSVNILICWEQLPDVDASHTPPNGGAKRIHFWAVSSLASPTARRPNC